MFLSDFYLITQSLKLDISINMEMRRAKKNVGKVGIG